VNKQIGVTDFKSLHFCFHTLPLQQ